MAIAPRVNEHLSRRLVQLQQTRVNNFFTSNSNHQVPKSNVFIGKCMALKVNNLAPIVSNKNATRSNKSLKFTHLNSSLN